MPLARRVKDFADLEKVRQAQVIAAKGRAQDSAAAYRLAEAEAAESKNHRDEAHQGWQTLLGAVRPQPELVRMGANWLLAKEQDLSAKELDRSIAQNRLTLAQRQLAEALAQEARVKKTSAKARKAMEKYREERSSNNLTDVWLWRRQS